MDATQDIILNLLHNLGSAKEIEQCLRLLTGDEHSKVILVKVGGGVLEQQFDDVVSATILLRRLGLRPVIVHGAGPQLDRALEEKGIAGARIDGQRVTTPDVLAVARQVFQMEGLRLADALDRAGVRARPVTGGLFHVALLDETNLGLVGRIVGVEESLISSILLSGYTPIISPLGETSAGQILNVNADIATGALAASLQPRKIVFLTSTGGLLDKDDRLIPAVNLAEDYDRLVESGAVTDGMALKIREVKSLLDTLSDRSSVSITSPDHLARELFTHKGHGTLVRRGVRIRMIEGVREVDAQRLLNLIEASFRRAIRSDYLVSRPIWRMYLAGDYTAVAVLQQTPDAVYLDKFAVTNEAQGAGIGASLWSRMIEGAPRLFWRARPDNPITPWYFTRADGMQRINGWIVFWRGIDDADAVERCIAFSLRQAPSFADQTPRRASKREPVLV